MNLEIFSLSGVCEKMQVCCLTPVVVNKGVQGVYGALYFLAVSSEGSETGSEGQEGGVCKHFVSHRPLLVSCRLILKLKSQKDLVALLYTLVKLHELNASSFLSFAVN